MDIPSPALSSTSGGTGVSKAGSSGHTIPDQYSVEEYGKLFNVYREGSTFDLFFRITSILQEEYTSKFPLGIGTMLHFLLTQLIMITPNQNTFSRTMVSASDKARDHETSNKMKVHEC